MASPLVYLVLSDILELPTCLGFLALNVNNDGLDSRWLLNIFNLTNLLDFDWSVSKINFLCADLD